MFSSLTLSVNQRLLDVNRLFCDNDNALWSEINRLMDATTNQFPTTVHMLLTTFEHLSTEEQDVEGDGIETDTDKAAILADNSSGRLSNWKGKPLTTQVLRGAIKKLQTLKSELDNEHIIDSEPQNIDDGSTSISELSERYLQLLNDVIPIDNRVDVLRKACVAFYNKLSSDDEKLEGFQLIEPNEGMGPNELRRWINDHVALYTKVIGHPMDGQTRVAIYRVTSVNEQPPETKICDGLKEAMNKFSEQFADPSEHMVAALREGCDLHCIIPTDLTDDTLDKFKSFSANIQSQLNEQRPHGFREVANHLLDAQQKHAFNSNNEFLVDMFPKFFLPNFCQKVGKTDSTLFEWKDENALGKEARSELKPLLVKLLVHPHPIDPQGDRYPLPDNDDSDTGAWADSIMDKFPSGEMKHPDSAQGGLIRMWIMMQILIFRDNLIALPAQMRAIIDADDTLHILNSKGTPMKIEDEIEVLRQMNRHELYSLLHSPNKGSKEPDPFKDSMWRGLSVASLTSRPTLRISGSVGLKSLVKNGEPMSGIRKEQKTFSHAVFNMFQFILWACTSRESSLTLTQFLSCPHSDAQTEGQKGITSRQEIQDLFEAFVQIVSHSLDISLGPYITKFLDQGVDRNGPMHRKLRLLKKESVMVLLLQEAIQKTVQLFEKLGPCPRLDLSPMIPSLAMSKDKLLQDLLMKEEILNAGESSLFVLIGNENTPSITCPGYMPQLQKLVHPLDPEKIKRLGFWIFFALLFCSQGDGGEDQQGDGGEDQLRSATVLLRARYPQLDWNRKVAALPLKQGRQPQGNTSLKDFEKTLMVLYGAGNDPSDYLFTLSPSRVEDGTKFSSPFPMISGGTSITADPGEFHEKIDDMCQKNQLAVKLNHASVDAVKQHLVALGKLKKKLNKPMQTARLNEKVAPHAYLEEKKPELNEIWNSQVPDQVPEVLIVSQSFQSLEQNLQA